MVEMQLKSSPQRRTYRKQLWLNNNRCWYCGIINTNFDATTLDHKLPVSRFFNHTAENLVLCCIDCNRLKNNKTVEEFREFLFFRFRLKFRFHGEKPNYLNLGVVSKDKELLDLQKWLAKITDEIKVRRSKKNPYQFVFENTVKNLMMAINARDARVFLIGLQQGIKFVGKECSCTK